MIEWIRFGAGILFLLIGMLIFGVQLVGVFRYKYVLQRMHAAAMGDTLGISFSLVGLMFFSGWNFTTLKLALVILFLWCASPVSSHLIARLEVTTNEHLSEHCRVEEEMQDEKKKETRRETKEEKA